MKFIITILSISLVSFSGFSQQREVTGKIIDVADSLEMPGVNVVLKGTLLGTATDFNGEYSLKVPDSDSIILVYTFVGYSTIEQKIGRRRVVDVSMSSNLQELDEVIVTGYGSELKADIIGSISSVSAKDFEDMPVVGMDQALQGQAPGVQVTQSSGTPGGGISVRVRGSTSISASNRPLFIIDGVPVEDGALALRSFGGQNDNALATLNPNDIETMQVLKDAAAKAIYGSRAANGVVLVTTKRGKGGKTQFDFDVQRGVIDLTKKIELLNSTQLLELQREAVVNAGGNPDASGLIRGVTNAIDTDWIDEITRTGIYEQYQLSMRGGNEVTRIYVSGNYRDEEGVQFNNKFERMSGAINLDHKINSKFSMGLNLTLAKTKNNRIKGDNFLDGVYSGAVKSLPFYSPYDEDGNLIGVGSPSYPGFPNFNPVIQAIVPRFETHATKILSGIFAKYQILDNLSFNTKASIDYNGVIEDQFEASSTAIGGFLPSVGGSGYGVNSSGVYTTFIQNNVVSYNLDLGSHSISALAGTEILQRTIRSSNVQGRLFPSDDFTYITSAGVVDAGSSFYDQNGLLSGFTEAKYSYDDKYYGSASFRADGSSRFGPGKQVGFFPSVSAGWRISSEEFMQKFSFLDDMKLRTSFGYTGNERIGNYGFFGTWSAATYNGATGTAPAGVGNPELQWERTRELNIGLDFAFLNGRIQVTADAYDNLTDKLLLTRLLPFTTGFGGVTGNVGNVSNRGVELNITSVNLDGIISWRTSLNLSRNVNMVKALSDTLPIFSGYGASGASATSIVTPGEALGTFWGLNFLGVDPATGDAIYDDINGDGEITDEDAMVIGSAQPIFIGGITNTLGYKNFDLTIFIQFSYGNDILNFSNTTLLNTGEDIESNQSIKALDRWREDGDITSVPRYELGNTYNNRHSSRFIEDGSYARIKNLSLGYNVPTPLISRFGLMGVRAYVSGTNLFTLSNYSGGDPEVSTLDGSTSAQGTDLFTLPQVRTIMLGVKVKF